MTMELSLQPSGPGFLVQEYEGLEEIWNHSRFCFNMWHIIWIRRLKWIDEIDGNEFIVEIVFPKQTVTTCTFLLDPHSCSCLFSINTHSLVNTGENDENYLARKLSTLSSKITNTNSTPNYECGFTWHWGEILESPFEKQGKMRSPRPSWRDSAANRWPASHTAPQ